MGVLDIDIYIYIQCNVWIFHIVCEVWLLHFGTIEQDCFFIKKIFSLQVESLSFPNSLKCVDDYMVVGHDGDLKLFINMCFWELTVVWKRNNCLMSFLRNKYFWHFCLLLSSNDTTHETSNLGLCYVLSHISPMIDHVIDNQCLTLLLLRRLMCFLVTFAMGKFLKVTWKWWDVQLSGCNHTWHIVITCDLWSFDLYL